ATWKKAPDPPATSTVETPGSVSRGRTRSTNGVIDSRSAGLRARIRSSRIMKLVAEVSSSISSAEAPASTAATRDAACEVEPEVSGPERDEGREGCEGMGRSVREGGWGCQAGSWELSGASS